ncbi:hypothetical protein [Nocardioides aurantiacus]|uniref:Uncharacterized protein n=1 Tax=Nocardioides aurantiacus TaxID=86796 RepID=A0A3N2CTQ8_9ACTN|nr:hypothetical protein [Nocardioides aurantiacus]ROR90905.1 hypothetical protein EDD33_1754 [Nocardioides aurantiacus]
MTERDEHGVIDGQDAALVIRDVAVLPGADELAGTTLVSRIEGSHDLLIHTGDQWGPYDVVTRVLARAPGEPGPRWEDVVELSITVSTPLQVSELIDGDPSVTLVAEPGEYRLRVSAQGRSHLPRDDEERFPTHTDEVVEWYEVAVWSAPPQAPSVLRLRSLYALEQLHPTPPLVVPGEAAGLAAAGRIGRDVDGAPGSRVLSGRVTTVVVKRTIRGTRRRLFLSCSYLTSWSHVYVDGPSWSFSDSARTDYELGAPNWSYAHKHPDQLTGRYGAVQTTFLEVAKPQRAVREWVWLRGHANVRVNDPRITRAHAAPTMVTTTLTQTRDAEGQAWTTITLEHAGLPAEWAADMETYWNYQLAIADHADFGTR